MSAVAVAALKLLSSTVNTTTTPDLLAKLRITTLPSSTPLAAAITIPRFDCSVVPKRAIGIPFSSIVALTKKAGMIGGVGEGTDVEFGMDGVGWGVAGGGGAHRQLVVSISQESMFRRMNIAARGKPRR